MKLTSFLIYFLFITSCTHGQKPLDTSKRTTDLPVASPEEMGFNQDSLDFLLSQISTTKHKDFRGMVVIKNGHIVIEEYYNTFWRNSILDIRSAGKSITALLLGAAMEDGSIQDLDQSVYDLFKENKNYTINEDYKKIKLRDVLDMSSGLDADTDRLETAGHSMNWIALDDWKPFLLNVPLVDQPGKNWVYADINALLVGMAIEEATGMSLRDYAKERLFDPLGITQFYWYTNASNQTGAAGNLYLSTLDFAKLGMLVVNGGLWNGKQIIDSDYLKQLVAHKKFDLSRITQGDAYGFLWYKTSRAFGDKKLDYLFASGNGGNHLIVVPDENMVIALTSSAYGQGYGHGRSYGIMSLIFASMK